MDQRKFTIAAVQQPCGDADKLANVERAVGNIRRAAGQGAQIVCLPEMFNSPYFCKVESHERFDIAEPIPGPTTQRMQELARELGVAIIVPIFERRAAGVYHNSAGVIDADGSLLGVYRKMHIPDDPLYYEKFYFTPGEAAGGAGILPASSIQTPLVKAGETPAPHAPPVKAGRTPAPPALLPKAGGTPAPHAPPAKAGGALAPRGFQVFDTRFARIGVLICWDQWYPEAARITSLMGAQVLFYPTAIGWHPAEKEEWGAAQVDAWRTAQRAHAIANGVFVAAPNRIGHEEEPGTKGITFFGRSFIADPFGRYLADAGEGEEILIAKCDPALIEDTRRNWPFLRDRRVDAYGPILNRYIGS
jgi:N-carbamoylputrescine amidase